MTTNNNFEEEQSSRDQLVETLGHLLVILGAVTFIASSAITPLTPWNHKGIP